MHGVPYMVHVFNNTIIEQKKLNRDTERFKLKQTLLPFIKIPFQLTYDLHKLTVSYQSGRMHFLHKFSKVNFNSVKKGDNIYYLCGNKLC